MSTNERRIGFSQQKGTETHESMKKPSCISPMRISYVGQSLLFKKGYDELGFLSPHLQLWISVASPAGESEDGA